MNIDVSKIRDLYTLYGFEQLEETKNYLVFSHSEGYFCNAEILQLNLAQDISAIRRQYEDTGYSVKVSAYSSIEDIHRRLFSGFFSQRNITQ